MKKRKQHQEGLLSIRRLAQQTIPALALAALLAAGAGAQPIAWDFEGGDEGWSFNAPGGIFTAPAGVHGNGALKLQSSNNINTFGFWDSPDVLLPFMTIKGEGHAQPEQASPTLYIGEWEVTSDVTPADQVPQFRLRSTLSDLSLATIHTVTSLGSASYAPDLSTRKTDQITQVTETYQSFFAAPSARDAFFSFDMLNIDPNDDATGELGLKSLSVEATSPPGGPPDAVEADLDFGAGTHGFTERSPAAATTPLFSQDANGLHIQGLPDLSKAARDESAVPKQPPFIFGSWGKETGITLQGGSAYIIRFLVGSDTPNANASEVPTFRLRVNDSSFQASWYVNVDSTGSIPRVPTDSNSETYFLILLAPQELDGKDLIFSFDYLYVGGDNNPRDKLTLERLVVERYDPL